MCCRFYYDQQKLDAFLARERQRTRREMAGRAKIRRVHSGDIHPADEAVVVTGGHNDLALDVMRWGCTLPTGRLVINARGETVSTKQMFAESMKKNRCVMPADRFYEWDRSKTKVTFRRKDGEPLYLAGCYHREADAGDALKWQDHFVVITTAANESMAPVHDRMPILIAERDIPRWILDDSAVEGILKGSMPLLYGEKEYEQLTLF